jgi:GTP-binding protein
MIALNKVDVPDALELAEFVKESFEARGYRVFIISAASHKGLKELNFALAEIVTKERTANLPQSQKRISLLPQKKEESSFVIRNEQIGGEDVFRIMGS